MTIYHSLNIKSFHTNTLKSIDCANERYCTLAVLILHRIYLSVNSKILFLDTRPKIKLITFATATRFQTNKISDVDGRIILRWIFRKWVGTGGGHL